MARCLKTEKSLIQDCERGEVALHFEWTKVHKKCQNGQFLQGFLKTETCSQTVLPDKSTFFRTKIGEKCHIKNSNNTF